MRLHPGVEHPVPVRLIRANNGDGELGLFARQWLEAVGFQHGQQFLGQPLNSEVLMMEVGASTS